ncbi:MAG: Fis family transcriptional regulator, partial [Marivirga sp.]|nr:Fis family transcriptional regulator [Marivirga sp.]
QEKEIERIGGKTIIKTDVRIIAATNRNLEREVNEGKFRKDLYYRLNVFPITIPPLRDRRNDIPLLASFFVTKFSKNSGKKITSLSNNIVTELTNYDWPGNVRELEHLIERSVLITQGNTIKKVHLPTAKNTSFRLSENRALKTFEDNERDHILFILQKCNGKIYGQGGAAELLGLKVSTLNSKIKKLGIKKENFFDQEKVK